jgi:hypothetical protein
VYLEFSGDVSVYAAVQEYVIDVTANLLDLSRGKVNERELRRAVKNDVIMTFGWWQYLLWAWRIARLISFILDQYRQQSNAETIMTAIPKLP